MLLEELVQQLTQTELEDARVVFSTLKKLSSKIQCEQLAGLDFKSCLVLDSNYNDAHICSLVGLFPIASLLVVGEAPLEVAFFARGENSLEEDNIYKPRTFVRRFHDNQATYTF
jgi:hypothetical protein